MKWHILEKIPLSRHLMKIKRKKVMEEYTKWKKRKKQMIIKYKFNWKNLVMMKR